LPPTFGLAADNLQIGDLVSVLHLLKKSALHSFFVLIGTLALLSTVLSVPMPVQAAPSAIRYVSATGTVGDGTSCASPGFVGATGSAIQAAINAASSGDSVHVCAGTYSISSRLDVAKSLTIRGDGASVTTLDGLGTTQIMIIQDNNLAVNSGSEITVNVEGLGFVNGYAAAIGGNLGDCTNGDRCGGAIFIESESRFSITDSYFRNNSADFIGGAVARFIGNYQTVPGTITNSTFESNTAVFDGGAVATLFGFGLTIESSTFYKNTITSRSAAAVIANFASATINNSTFVDNTGPSGTTVLYGGITVNKSIIAQSSASMIKVCNSGPTVSGSRGNLVTDNSCTSVTSSYPATPATNSAIVSYADLKLGDLSYRGYVNKTIPLLSGSVALDFWSGCTGNDQRGISRPQGGSCDVGAYERPSAQTVNTLTGWSYSASSFSRGIGATVEVVSPASDVANAGVSYLSLSTGVCTVNEFTGTITVVSAGTCNLTATSLGNLLNDQDQLSKSLTISIVAKSSIISEPTVSGTNRAGMTLTATSGTWSNSASSYSYQWKSSATSDGTYSDIAGADSPTYILMAADVGRFIKVSVIANNAGGASTAWLSSARGSIDDYLAGLNPVLSTATATDDGFTFTITNYSASYTFAATTTSGSVSLTGANGVVTGLPANGTATVTVTSSRAGYTTLSTTREGSTVVTVTTTVVVRTTTTVAATPVVPTTVAVSETPVVTVPQGQASVGTIAPSVGPTTTVLNPMRLQAPQTATTTIPPVVKNAALIPTVAAPEAPAVAPGEAAVTADGEVVETTVTRADNQITATAGEVSTSVFGLAADGTRVALNAEGNLVLNEGDKLVVSASGYAPNQDVDAWLYSTPSLLGAMTADGDGKVSGAFNLPSGLDVGDHRLVLSGENPDGAAVLVGIGLSYGTVQSGSTVTRVLIAIPIALAVLFGLFLPAVTRRRKKNAFA
jgi:hypothetical protein